MRASTAEPMASSCTTAMPGFSPIRYRLCGSDRLVEAATTARSSGAASRWMILTLEFLSTSGASFTGI
jgi:hypothetical protein